MAGITSPKEALLMAPGEIFDVWELYLQANGLKEKPPEV